MQKDPKYGPHVMTSPSSDGSGNHLTVPFSMVHFPYENSDLWMKTSSELNGDDVCRLLERHGFRIDDVRRTPVEIWLEREKTSRYIRDVWLCQRFSPNMDPNVKRGLMDAFMARYHDRVNKSLSDPSAVGFHEKYIMFRIFASKATEEDV